MKLKNLPLFEVFVDASIFVYYLNGDAELAQACIAFFERVARGEIQALTSVVVGQYNMEGFIALWSNKQPKS